ncbi:CRISPR/Cas system associated protein [Bacillus phage Eoghan]|uniref:CRISPR/Cas system associated protein n=2 Tax=Andromedavirus TaxID=1623275 RepID=M1IE69_9CAUD|nr:CRISPR/Cas system associated protein [Bacillus phage Eoghan]YP_009592274.1 CRISPR/Cas system associated protein [Bacillus phage Taylor]AGE60805.1 CRISPR/Cas system associated protein [Bacillus phage Eoghan]AGE60959.1 CRISPR/Cas system associated protein [Bacillus phage Taylor]
MRNDYPLKRASYSQLNTFMSCPHEFYLTYIAGQRSEGNKYTVAGSNLHEIFEAHSRAQQNGKELTRKDLLTMYNKAFKQYDKKMFNDKEDLLKMYEKGVSAIDHFLDTYSHEEAPCFIEREFIADIGEGIPLMKSFVDRIDGDKDDPSTWIVTDYKTGSNPKSKKYLSDDLQLGLYIAQIHSEFGSYPKAVQFYHPVIDKFQTAIHKGDGVYRFTNQRDPVVEFSVSDILVRTRLVVDEIVKAVETNNFPKKIDAFKCKFCFKFQDGSCKPFEQTGWGAL